MVLMVTMTIERPMALLYSMISGNQRKEAHGDHGGAKAQRALDAGSGEDHDHDK